VKFVVSQILTKIRLCINQSQSLVLVHSQQLLLVPTYQHGHVQDMKEYNAEK